MGKNIDELLKAAVDRGASDIHIKVGAAPVIRADGELKHLSDFPSLTPEDTQGYAEAMLTPKATADIEANGVADFAYGKQELGRFRVTAFRQRGSMSLVLRRVVPGSRSFADLGLPRVTEKVISTPGLALITGKSGSGKTTTMASIVDWLNTNKSLAIVTIEDPIEVLHPDKKSVVVQREVGVDTPNLTTAIRSAVRHDVDVIMISELPDEATARAAIDAAETGRLVVASMRTSDPAETVNRLVTMVPESERPTVRRQLANTLNAIVSQVLIDSGNANRVLACEVMTINERTEEWLLRGGDQSSLFDILKDGGFYGMQTFDQAMLKHVVERNVDIGVVLPHVRNTHEIRAKAMEAGIAS